MKLVRIGIAAAIVSAMAWASVGLVIVEQEVDEAGIHVTVQCDGWEPGSGVVALMTIDGVEVIVDDQPIDPVTGRAVVTFPFYQPGNAVAYRGPAGEIPPDSREPSDPPPPTDPTPPQTPDGDGGGPDTGGGSL